MPYNTTPIAPPKEYSGTASLPLARVKKIITADDDIAACSNNAAFAITVATEMFIQHIVEQTYNVVKADSKRARRNIQYRDVANAVARVDNLEFLSDVVPRTMTYKAFLDKKAKEDAAKIANESGTGSKSQAALPRGQQTMEQMAAREHIAKQDLWTNDEAMEDIQHHEDQAEPEGTEEHNHVLARANSDVGDTLLSESGPHLISEQKSAPSRTAEDVLVRSNYDTVRNGYKGGGSEHGMPMEE